MKDNQINALRMEASQKQFFTLMNLLSIVTIIGYGSSLLWAKYGDGFYALAEALS